MSITDRLDQIEARANAADRGRWEAYRPNPAYRIYEICSTTPQGLDETLAEVSGYNASDNAEFMAAARDDVSDLVAALRAVLGFADYWEALPPVGGSSAEQWEFDTLRDAGKELRRAIEEAMS